MGRTALTDLWEKRAEPGAAFNWLNMPDAPEAGQRYLEHAISPKTRLASAVRLEMKGEIKVGAWVPFTAVQVMRVGKGMVWQAKAKFGPGFISGHDQLINGKGEMKWKLLGLFPLFTATGPDVSRANQGRMAGESVWLPSRLCAPDVVWSEPKEGSLSACFPQGGQLEHLNLDTLPNGRVKSMVFPRWGNPGGKFELLPFGGVVLEEKTFGGYTIPSKINAGWYFGSDRFEEFEFFRCEITKAEYR